MVVAARGAYAVGKAHFIALRALGKAGGGEEVVGASLVTPSLGCFSFGNPHLDLLLRSRHGAGECPSQFSL